MKPPCNDRKQSKADMKRMHYIITLLLGWVLCAGLLCDISYAQPPKPVVVIDAAHGGADTGVKISDNIPEKEITLKLAHLVQKELSRDGQIQVVLTRDSDKDVSVNERIKKIETARPRAMISLHVNAGFGKKAKGFEVYFPGFKGGKDGKDESAAIINDMKKTKHLNDSVRLAQMVQRQLNSVFPKENRGLREAPLPLLEGLSIPGVVVEIGFSGNPDNHKKIIADKYQQDIARALAKGIRDSL